MKQLLALLIRFVVATSGMGAVKPNVLFIAVGV